MKLVELVRGPETSEVVVKVVKDFLEERMGKGVVFAKDTPGFIANRIGAFFAMNSINKAYEKGWPVDLVDAVIGKAASFPGSAVFRTADLVGIDVLLLVAGHLYQSCKNDSLVERFLPNKLIESMVSKGHKGIKSGIGFYKKDKGEILVIDKEVGNYRKKISYNFDSLKRAKKIDNAADRVKALFEADDEAANIAKELICDLLEYSTSVAEEISDSPADIDNALKWGYNWELGPLELCDLIGFQNKPRYYQSPRSTDSKRGEVLEKNAGASLFDIGDGVVCCEFHSKMNSIDPDIIAMLNRGLDVVESEDYLGLLVTNDARDFSVGANLFMIAMAISSKSWDQIENLVKAFQDVGMRMRFSPKPVVAAPFGRTLGGGCEVCLAAGNVALAAETYMGLVELGVGLIPAGGGCKNLLLSVEENSIACGKGPFPKAAKTFEIIGMAKVSNSGLEAIELGYIPKWSKVVINRDTLTDVAKKCLIQLSNGYHFPERRDDILLSGRGGELAICSQIKDFHALGKITDYDAVVASNLSHILCGGNQSTVHTASEQDILDLEREVFLKLCGMKETAERIQHMLTTGKPLRN